MDYTIKEVAAIIGAEVFGKDSGRLWKVVLDSRKLIKGNGHLFFALRGKNHDGHNYLEQCASKGITCFVVEELPEKTPAKGLVFLKVGNALRALQNLASHHRKRFGCPVVGITGSNGKTIVKEWICHVLHGEFTITKSPKSYNSQIGVPLSVLGLNRKSNLGVFEAGISEAGEMQALEKIVSPTIGLISNIGPAHEENFLSNYVKLNEKLDLFQNSKTILYCKDHPHVSKAVETRFGGHAELFSWSQNDKSATVWISSVRKESKASTMEIVYRGQVKTLKVPFTDKASIENAMHALCVALVLKKHEQAVWDNFGTLTPVAMRLELRNGINGCLLVNDYYNNDIQSLEIAIDFLNQQHLHGDKILIVSDIIQSGTGDKDLYPRLAEISRQKGLTQVIGIGQKIGAFRRYFNEKSLFYADTEGFIKDFDRNKFMGSSILIKGARRFQFEKIANLLEEKTHSTVLEVNLNNLSHNLSFFRSLLKPQTMVMVMVKAFSYGSGSSEIARLLEHERVDYLGVAFPDEGVELREAGIGLPIMVLNPHAASHEIMIAYNLEPEIYNFTGLYSFLAAARKNAVADYPVHIKLDTGMHRLGFEEKDMDQLLSVLQGERSLCVQSFFSHLAAADDVAYEGFTNKQIALFEQLSHKASSALGIQPIRHILNSAGIENYGQAQFDMVRLGIGLYGMANKHQGKLKPVSQLKTYISQVKTLQNSETVGYSRKGKICGTKTIATVPIGYADGLNRHLGNGKGVFYVASRPAPVIGNICMDMCMLDVTGLDAKEGDEVVVFGEKPDIRELAKKLGTIPYEILTGVSPRVKRTYIYE